MALVLQDRVSVNSTGSGTGSLVLGSAYPGYRSFSSCIPDGSIVYYTITNQAVGYDTEWEVGYGKYVSGTNTLVRNNGNSAETGVYSSSNANAYVSFTAGTNGLQVFITQPAGQAVYQDVDGITTFPENYISVVGANATAPTFATTLSSFVSNVDSFSQLVAQNQSANANASADIVSYNNLGDGASYFVDMGINSSTYNSVDYPIFTENSAYLFSGGDIGGTGAAGETSDLFVGTSTANSNVYIFAGGVNTSDTVVTINASSHNVSFDNNISVTANVSANNVNITNFAYSGANLAAAANNTVLVTKEYVDNATSNGFHVHNPVLVATTGNLTATYNNGTDGVGATLTNSGAQAALSVDGVSLSVGNRVLVWQQTTGTQNGVYTVTTVGSGATNWVLTRATDADTAGEGNPNSLGGGDYFFVQSGTLNGYHSYVCTNTTTITFGSTAITFSEFSSVPSYVGTAPINVSGQTIALTGIVDEAHGGTNASTYTTGDIIYSNATNTLAKLAIGSQYSPLVVSGSGTPSWGSINLASANAVSGTLGATNGGTGQTTYTTGDILYSSATNTLSKLAGQTTTTKKYLQQQGTGTDSAAPSWQQVAAADISGLAPSATTDTSNASNITSGTLPTGRLTGSYTGITGVGTLTAGTWTANVVGATYGGTGIAGTLTGISYMNGTSAHTAASAAQVVAVIGSTAVANATYAVSSGSSGTTTTATNLAGGAAGSVPYQSGSGTTQMLATGSGVLVGGTTPAWSTAPTLTGTNFSSIPNSATTATAANTASAIVARDASGNFTAGTITATTFSGSGASLTSLNGSNVTSGTVDNARTTATSANTASAIVARDASGNFSAGVVTASVFSGAGTSLTGTAASLTAGAATILTGDATNWASLRSNTVANMLGWKNYGNGHVIFDASQSLSPTGSAVNNTNAAVAWSSTYPTLMGWNGSSTYGVRVDSARVADSATSASSATTATTATTATNQSGGSVNATTGAFNSTVTFAGGSGVSSTGDITARRSSGTSGVVYFGNGTPYIYFDGTNYQVTGSTTFNVANAIVASGNVTAYSDERLKTNWRSVQDNYVTKLAKIKSGVYDRTDTKETQAGVSAQSLQTLLPETILEGTDGTLSVNYGAAAMVSVVELAKVVEELRAEIADLKSKIKG